MPTLPVYTIPQTQDPLASSLGTGLGNLLQSLATSKTQQLAKQQQAFGLQALMPDVFTPEKAQAASFLPQELLKPVISENLKSKRQIEDVGPGLKVVARELTDEQASKLAKTPKGVQNLWYKNYLENPQQAIAALNDLPKADQSITPKEERLNNQINKLIQKRDSDVTQPLNESLVDKQQEIPKEPELSPEKVITTKDQVKFLQQQIRKLEPEKKDKSVSELMAEGKSRTEANLIIKEQHKKQAEIRHKNDEIKTLTNDAYRASKDDTIRMDEMMDLNEKGNLGFPLLNSIVKTITKGVKGVGVDLSYLMTKDAQKFDKLATDFLKNAKQYFGSRMTEGELNTFLRTIPSLANSKEGRRELIRNARIFLEAKKIRKLAMDTILKQYKDQEVPDLDSKIEEIAGPLLDNLADQFKASVNFPQQKPNILGSVLQTAGLSY